MALLEQLAAGETLSAIAAKYQCSALAISTRLEKESPETYRRAREFGVETRLADSRLAMKQAANAFQLALAREGFKADVWFAECEFPERWRQTGRAQTPRGQAPLLQIVLSDTEGRPQVVESDSMHRLQGGMPDPISRPPGKVR